MKLSAVAVASARAAPAPRPAAGKAPAAAIRMRRVSMEPSCTLVAEPVGNRRAVVIARVLDLRGAVLLVQAAECRVGVKCRFLDFGDIVQIPLPLIERRHAIA